MMRIAAVVFALQLLSVPFASADGWAKIREDGLHDPRSPAVKEKQEPGDALGALAKIAPDPSIGNQVRWVTLLEQGAIQPRTNILPGTPVKVLDLDLYLNIGGGMPIVRFPHKEHTMWLDCANCHNGIFKDVAGTSPISMLTILEGEQCGICHGAVAFPLTQCYRCHSVKHADFPEIEKRLGLVRVGAKRQVGVPAGARK